MQVSIGVIYEPCEGLVLAFLPSIHLSPASSGRTLDGGGLGWSWEWWVSYERIRSPRTSGFARLNAKTLELQYEHEHAF